MENQVTVYNIADTIREKVKDYIIQSIPKEQLDQLIKQQWDAFFQDKSNNWERKPSEFNRLVQDAIQKEIQVKIDEAVREELKRFASSWDSTGQKVIKDAVSQYAPAFIEGLAAHATQAILQAEAQRRGLY